MSEVNLPSEWIATELENIGDVVTGKTPSKNKPEYFGGDIPFIKPGDVNDQGEITLTDEQITVLGAETVPLIPPGSIVVTCIGNLGRCAITSARSATNQQINSVLPSNKVDVKFLYYQLRTLKEWMLSESSATTVTIINKSKFSKAPIICPPIAEQKVIADKLDTLLAQVDTTKARLERIPEILKTFRQSVLAAAVSGKLTEEWRDVNKFNLSLPEKGKEKYKKDLYLTASKSLPELPSEWLTVPAANVLEYVTSGSRGWAKHYSDNGALFLRMSNVKYDSTKLDLDELQYVDLPENVEGKRSLVRKDDLVISITADVGRVARIESEFDEAYINQHLALVRPTRSVNSQYLATCIAAINIGIRQVQLLKRGATKAGLGLDDIRSLAIPFPSLPEQAEIVRRVDELFDVADKVEQKVHAALERVNSLTQSVLAKAFRGELTSDWRAANPELISGENSAKGLLAKIKTERAKLNQTIKGRGKSIEN